MAIPSQQLRADLNALVELARLAPLDECGWGWQHHAQNIEHILAGLDQEFFRLSHNKGNREHG